MPRLKRRRGLLHESRAKPIVLQRPDGWKYCPGRISKPHLWRSGDRLVGPASVASHDVLGRGEQGEHLLAVRESAQVRQRGGALGIPSAQRCASSTDARPEWAAPSRSSPSRPRPSAGVSPSRRGPLTIRVSLLRPAKSTRRSPISSSSSAAELWRERHRRLGGVDQELQGLLQVELHGCRRRGVGSRWPRRFRAGGRNRLRAWTVRRRRRWRAPR
jgi:hypothetical protein